YFFDTVEHVWGMASAGQPLAREDQVDVRLACLTAVENSTAAVDIVYRLGGATSIFQSCPIERCWRDVHAAAQHVQVQAQRWETAGRAIAGLEPQDIFF